MNITCIHAGADRIPEIQAIAYRTWPTTFGHLLSRAQIAYMLERNYSSSALEQLMTEGKHRFMVTERDGRAVGFTSYQLHYPSEHVFTIHKLYLLPEAQRSGIGTFVLHLLSARALELTMNTLRLRVLFNNTNAIQFYEQYGFSRTGAEATDIGGGFTVLEYVMTKKLTPENFTMTIE